MNESEHSDLNLSSNQGRLRLTSLDGLLLLTDANIGLGICRGQCADHRHEPPAVDRFLDVEAVVDDDEDEVEDKDEYARAFFVGTHLTPDEFIADTGLEGEDDYDMRVRELDDRDLEQVAEDISRLYRQTAVRYTGDMSDVPQRLLMPSVHDENLWQVRVRPRKERDIVFSLMRKAIDLEFSNLPLSSRDYLCRSS
ncbi:hypothetical protein GY45DRAFT_1341602 [Cubamyces sp. BRFM 1775]|nr:hypothetical protein GY45DRAFT_1341602 [Cubamyces sp. BRFM 1775]